MAAVHEAAARNLLLSRIDERIRTDVLQGAELVTLPVANRLMEEDAPLEHVYFPVSGVLSILRVFLNGASVEIGMIGCEGFLGIHAVLGVQTQPNAALVQHGGAAVRVRTPVFVDCFHRYESVRRAVLPYVHYFMTQTAQIAACNRAHSPTERLARWLLAMHDRSDGDELAVTQEFLSHMLATRRPTINAAVSELRHAGAIANRRNRVTIEDRSALENQACECYLALLHEGARVLNFRGRSRAAEETGDTRRSATAAPREDATMTAYRAADRRS